MKSRTSLSRRKRISVPMAFRLFAPGKGAAATGRSIRADGNAGGAGSDRQEEQSLLLALTLPAGCEQGSVFLRDSLSGNTATVKFRRFTGGRLIVVAPPTVQGADRDWLRADKSRE